jgi:NAD(P)-dependent dehydrogenase (short-subunit alcohol dehydrogenase family)
MGRLTGKIALITGASRGQGGAEAQLFAAEGAAVVLTDVLDQEGDALAAALRNKGAEAVYRHLDVTSAPEWQGAIDYVQSLHGKLDILVNNAGIAQRSGLLDASLDEWENVLRINLTGPFIGIQTAVPLMGRGGSIINVSSIAGMMGWRPPAYTASKWGLRGLSHSAALELVDRGIRVNVIVPGLIDTPFLDNRTMLIDALTKLTPMQRAGTSEEIAKLVLFLASDDSSFITGSEFVIDGGFVTGAAVKELMRTLHAAGA